LGLATFYHKTERLAKFQPFCFYHSGWLDPKQAYIPSRLMVNCVERKEKVIRE
jgi:hypothetical protein